MFGVEVLVDFPSAFGPFGWCFGSVKGADNIFSLGLCVSGVSAREVGSRERRTWR